ncbi:MAG: spore germination protein [Butyribacter sp.]|nr:spore germination protein [Butyribacter sp.]
MKKIQSGNTEGVNGKKPSGNIEGVNGEKPSDIFEGQYEERMKRIQELLCIDKNFDILHRQLAIGGRKASMFVVDGFLRTAVSEKVLEFFYSIQEEDMPRDYAEFVEKYAPYADIMTIDTQEKFIQFLLSGMSCFLIEGYQEIIAFDFREYPSRSIEEPDKDKVLRGSRDGFIESLVPNAALIRRRIRDVNLIFEIQQIGRSSKTDVAVVYMKDRVKEASLKEIKRRLQNIDVDSLTMNKESLSEMLFPRNWYNPFPRFKYSERPDTAAACLLEGSIILLVDNSPAAMILPTSLFSILEDANEYYFPPVTGTYLRMTRMLTSIIAIYITPVFLLLLQNPQWVPEWLEFILIKDKVNVPPVIQLLILEFAIDGLKMASINTPNMLTTPLSIVAGIVFGDYTVSSGWFNSEIMLYMAFVAVANYTQSNMELGYAIKFFRILCLVLTAWLGLPGFIAGSILLAGFLIGNPVLVGKGYLYPLIPFNGRQLLKRFFRVSLPYSEKRG